MTDEPKKLIEAHLEAHAAQRRLAAGGPFELDDAVRLRLLAEVEKVHGLVMTPVAEAPTPETAPVFQPLFTASAPTAAENSPVPVLVQEELVPATVLQATVQEPVPEVPPAITSLPPEDEALRQTLQAELQRTESPRETVAAEESSGQSAWTMLWTRLAFSFGVVALVGFAAFIVRLQIPADRASGALAKLEPVSEEKAAMAGVALAEATTFDTVASPTTNAGSLAMAGASASAVPLVAANDALPPANPAVPADRDLMRRQLSPAETREQTRSEQAVGRSLAAGAVAPSSAPAQPEPASRPSVVESRTVGGGADSAKAKDERKSEAAQAAPAAPAPVASLPMAAGARPAVLREGSFVQRTVPSGVRRNFQSPRKPDVLTSFRLELVADTVQITDKDGSTYVGRRIGGEGSSRFNAAGASETLGRSVTIDASIAPDEGAGSGDIIRGRISLGSSRWWEFEAVGR